MARFLPAHVLTGFVLAQAALGAQDVAALDAQTRAALVEKLRAHVEKHRRDPAEFLTEQLKRHDCVVLGEVHGFRQISELVAGVLPKLYRDGGLRVFASEFLRARFTERANALVTADEWDEAAMIELMRQGPWPTWGYRGYLEIYAVIWKINRGRPETAEPLELVGMDSDWSQYEMWFGGQSRAQRFQSNLEREKCMIAAVEKHGFEPNKKTLVHVGFAHSVTCHGVRLATVLTKKHGDRVVQVAIHHELNNARGQAPVSNLIGEVWGKQRGALRVRGTPLGELRDSGWPFARGLPNGNLGDLMQHMLFLVPCAELKPERWIQGFVSDETFEKALRIAERMSFVEKGECKNAKELDARLAEHFKD